MTIETLLASLKANIEQTDITLYPGASPTLIEQFEQEMSVVLPVDFKIFYSLCNGFESEEDMFRMIPLEEIVDSKPQYQPKQFYIAEYLIYCDMWEVELTDIILESYRIYNMNVTLTNSLAVFLNRFLQGGVFGDAGLYNWQKSSRA